MGVEVIVRKWGNSLGIVLPKEVIEQRKIKMNDTIHLELVKKADLTPVFGTLKSRRTGQQFKDMVRKGWEK